MPREMEHPHRQEKGWETARTQLNLTDSEQISAADVTTRVRLVGTSAAEAVIKPLAFRLEAHSCPASFEGRVALTQQKPLRNQARFSLLEQQFQQNYRNHRQDLSLLMSRGAGALVSPPVSHLAG